MSSFQLPPLENNKQFELLLADLLNEIYGTISFKLYGKTGHNQRGIDVLSTEKNIIVQCKHKDLSRSSIKIKTEILNDIEKTLTLLNKVPQSLGIDTLIIATTASENPDYDLYCEELKKERGIGFNILFWGWESIQSRLGTTIKTLAKHYPNYQFKTKTVEDINANRVVVKKKIQKDFSEWLDYSPENRKKRSRMIIHSISDTHYPEHKNENGPWFWFAAEIWKLSVKGLGFVTGCETIYVNDRGLWSLTEPAYDEEDKFRLLKVYKVSVIDFDDIVDYDLRGDNHYLCPHFFVRFNHNDSPFCEVYYQRTEKDQPFVPLYFDDSTKLIID